MGEWLDLSSGIGWFCAGLVLLFVVVATTRIRRLPLQRPARTTLSRAAVPAHERALLDGVSARLEALGFAYGYSLLTRKLLALPGKDRGFSDVYEHPGEGVLAWVERAETPEYGEPVVVSFATAYAGGTSDLTVNRFKHYVTTMPPAWTVHDDYLREFESAFRAHVLRTRKSSKSIERDGSVLRQRYLDDVNRLFAHWLQTGFIVPSPVPDRWRFAWTAALRITVKALAGAGRAARAKPKLAAAAPAAGAVDKTALERQYAVEKSVQWSKEDKHWLTWISLAAFAALGTWIWDWQFMLILAAVIAVHEGGHYLAMRWVGYRNLHVFFVPGLGGLATGEKADASPLQKVFVYLAGPMPGLVVAVAAAIAFGDRGLDAPPWVSQLVLATIVVNFLNLLPITPLDGGRVAETLLFAKVPLMRLLFAGTCALALFGAGLYLEDWVLRIIGLLVLLSMPHQWRVYRLETALPAREGALSEAAAKVAVFDVASKPEFARWSFADRSAAAIALVDEVQARKPRWGETAIGLLVYVACLVAPVAAVVELTAFGDTLKLIANVQWAGRDASESSFVGPPETRRDWAAEIAKASSQPPAERLEVMLAAIRAGYDEENSTGPSSLQAKAWEIAKTLPVGDRRRSEALIAGIRVEEDGEVRSRKFRQAEEELSGVQGEDALLLADLLQFKAWVEHVEDPAAAAEAVQRALGIRLAILPTDHASVVATRNDLAGRLYLAGRREEAGTLLVQSVDATRALADERRWNSEELHAGFLVAEGRAAEAEPRLKALAAELRAKSGDKLELALFEETVARKILWAQLAQGTPDSASRALATLGDIEMMKGYGGRSVSGNACRTISSTASRSAALRAM